MSDSKIDKFSLLLILLSVIIIFNSGESIVNGIDVRYNLFMFGLNVFAMTVNFTELLRIKI